MSDKEKGQTGIPRPARGLPRPTSGLPRPTAQTGAGRGPPVKIAFGQRILSSKAKPRQDEEETAATTPGPLTIQKPAVSVTVTKDKTVKRLRSSGSYSNEEAPAAQGAKRANMEEKLSGTITKKGYKLRPAKKTKNPVNGICTTNFNPKAKLNFTEFGGFTGKKSLPKQTVLEKENAVLSEQLKATKEELAVIKEELQAKASHEKAIDAGKLELEEENQQLKKDLEKCEKKLISLDIDPVSLDTWWELKKARVKQQKETTARARVMLQKVREDNEQLLKTNKQLRELKERIHKIGQQMSKPEDSKA